MSDDLLAISLSAAVPLWAMKMKARGGPTEEEQKRAGETGQLLAERGDRLLFRSRVPGETAELFNRTAEAIAVLSFCPGGVTLFGSHWETKLEEEPCSK